MPWGHQSSSLECVRPKVPQKRIKATKKEHLQGKKMRSKDKIKEGIFYLHLRALGFWRILMSMTVNLDICFWCYFRVKKHSEFFHITARGTKICYFYTVDRLCSDQSDQFLL